MRLRLNRKRLWENDIDIAPILSAYGAFTRPIGRIVQMIGDVRGPKASDVTVEEVALHRLAQAGGAARGIHFPSGKENQRAGHRDVRPVARRVLGSDPIILARRDMPPHAQRPASYKS